LNQTCENEIQVFYASIYHFSAILRSAQMYFNVLKLSPHVPCHLEMKIKKSTLGQLWSTLSAKVSYAIFNQIGLFKFFS